MFLLSFYTLILSIDFIQISCYSDECNLAPFERFAPTYSESPSRISRSRIPFTINTYTSVSKHATLSPLDSALTQNRGRGVPSAILSSPENPLLEVAKSILLIISALFPIVNPIGGSPVFLSLTGDYTASARRLLAWRITLNSFILIVASYLVGTHILAFFGISIPVVQVGGGLIVISNGWAMLKQKDPDERGQIQKNMNPADILRRAFYPLTLPLTVGPGSISAAITLGANAPRHLGGSFLSVSAAIVGAAIVSATIYVCYGFADRLAAVLGATGMNVILRLSSFLLVCIGVQIFWNGASALIKTLLAGHV